MALQRNQAKKEVYDNGILVDSWRDNTRPEDCTTKAIENAVRYYDLKGQNPEKNKADDCDCKNKSTKNATTNGAGGSSEYSPGNDHGDECFSFAQGNISQCSQAGNMIVYMKGYFEEMNSLIGGVLFDGVESAQKLLQISPLLIIPSGGLYGKENDSAFKEILSQYVRLGGNVIVLSQQSDFHYDCLPIGDRGKLMGVGFRNDQSCYSGSSYYSTMHPAISAFDTWNGVGNVNTDGYFQEFNDQCTVLLRRTKNRLPLAMVYYPFNDENSGAVLVSSMFTDWGAAHGQASITEKRLLRDFITYMKNPRKNILLLDQELARNNPLNLSINIKNSTEQTAARVKLTASNPDRDKIFHSLEQAISLEPGQESTIPLSFLLNGVTNTDYGISHVDYELYDPEGNLLQMAEESDGGRFAIYRSLDAYYPNRPYDVWIRFGTILLEPTGPNYRFFAFRVSLCFFYFISVHSRTS